MRSLITTLHRPLAAGRKVSCRETSQRPQQCGAVERLSSVTVSAAAIVTPELQPHQHYHAQHDAQHDVQQLPAAAAGIFQQLRQDTATLAASVQQQQQLLQQQQQYHARQTRRKHVTFDGAAAELTKQLKLAVTWQELQDLVRQYRPSSPPGQQQRQEQQQGLAALNPQLLSCLLSALVRCQPAPATAQTVRTPAAAAAARNVQGFNTLVGQVYNQVLLLLPQMQPRELSNVLWTAAKLDEPLDSYRIKQVLAQMTQPDVLATANAQDVSMCLYSVASLGIQVAEQQIELLLAAAAAQLDAAAPQALANTLWAVAVLQYRPSEQWLSQVEYTCRKFLQQQQKQQLAAAAVAVGPRSQQQQHDARGFSSKGLHQVLWAMAKLQWEPNDEFLTSYWTVTQQQLALMTPQGTTGILWAAATIDTTAPGVWLDTWFKATQLQMQNSRFGDIDLANALWAVVRLGLRPSDSWLQQGLASAEDVLARAGARELSVILWGFAKLGVRPPGAWMGLWLEAMHGRMNSYCAPSLACSAYTLALMRFKPPRPWCERLVAEMQRQMAAFGAQELSNIVWALATLGLRPNKAWFRDFQSQALNESSSFNSQELSILCWSLAKLHYTPPADWVAALLRDGLEAQSDMRGQSVVLLMWALARWRLRDIRENGKYRMLLPRYWAATHQLLPSCSLWQLSVLWWARVQLGCMPSKAWSRSFSNALIPRLSAAVEAAAAVGTATAGSAGTLQLQQQQESRAAAADPGYNASTVVRLIFAMGKMTGRVPSAAQRLLTAAAEHCVGSSSVEALTALGMGLVRMHRQAADAAVPAAAAAVGVIKAQTAAAAAAEGVKLIGRLGVVRQNSRRDAMLQHVQQCSVFWALWFARSTQLLQGQPVQQQHALDATTQGHSMTSTHHHQQQQQTADNVDSMDISMQLFIAGQIAAAVQPPSSWITAVTSAVMMQLGSMSLEQLSWVLWSVRALRVEHQLPDGWVPRILQRCRLLLHGDSSCDLAVVSRLHRSVKQLQRFGIVHDDEFRLWRRVYAQWSSSQGLLVQ